MKPNNMHGPGLFFDWAVIGVGWGVTAAALQKWFIDWNPVLQGLVLIATFVLTVVTIYYKRKTKEK